jgi:integrase
MSGGRQYEAAGNVAGWLIRLTRRHQGCWAIGRLNGPACLDYRDLRLGTVAPRTIRTELEALRAALHWGQTEAGGRVITVMPDLKLPPKGNPRPRWLTRVEADRLLLCCRDQHLRLFIEIGLHTGARSGAILALTWDRVDLDNLCLDFGVPGQVETNKRNVAQPINSDLHVILVAARASATGTHVITYTGDHVGSIKHGFATAAEQAGLTDVTPHTLRHTVITWMLQARVPIWEVAEFAGMTVKLIQETYGRATVEFRRPAAKALERRMP